ncbi:polyprotein [Plakobranchus ocellatus]|uniref:Polyprotein n=1 Tax=Plakobranchus ocellatus TaxID=259542 RepID=A0AAV3YJB9_9GAST|nr:polyprotein [Plakobranchus ocellatus]
MLEGCFNGFKMRFQLRDTEVGIAMGCTISPILFVLAMEVMRAAEGSASPADLGGGCYMPPLKAFIDDTTILCSKENETRRMLVRLDELEQNKFQAEEVSKRVYKKRQVCFKIASQDIPRIGKSPPRALENDTIHP